MMETLKKKAAAGPQAPRAANDTGAAATTQDIEISHPIELKMKPKPKSTFEL
jgi:hypothetical protein